MTLILSFEVKSILNTLSLAIKIDFEKYLKKIYHRRDYPVELSHDQIVILKCFVALNKIVQDRLSTALPSDKTTQ